MYSLKELKGSTPAELKKIIKKFELKAEDIGVDNELYFSILDAH